MDCKRKSADLSCADQPWKTCLLPLTLSIASYCQKLMGRLAVKKQEPVLFVFFTHLAAQPCTNWVWISSKMVTIAARCVKTMRVSAVPCYVDSFCHVVWEKTRIGSLWSPGQKRPEKKIPLRNWLIGREKRAQKTTLSDNIYRAIKSKVK